VPNDDHKYLLDTDVFVRICELEEKQEIFDSIIELAKLARVKTIRQVFGELKKWPVSLGMLKPYRSIIEIESKYEFTTEMQELWKRLGTRLSGCGSRLARATPTRQTLG